MAELCSLKRSVSRSPAKYPDQSKSNDQHSKRWFSIAQKEDPFEFGGKDILDAWLYRHVWPPDRNQVPDTVYIFKTFDRPMVLPIFEPLVGNGLNWMLRQKKKENNAITASKTLVLENANKEL
jgi:hypothetical protein